MTVAAVATPRPSPIDRLLNRWFATPTAPAGSRAQDGVRDEALGDLRTALEAASMCQVSALSAEYAHYLIDRHCSRSGERG